MRNHFFTLALGGALALGLPSGPTVSAQDNTTAASGAQTADQATAPDRAQASGQPDQGPMRMDPDKQLEHMTRTLGLSADQQSQIKPLLLDRQQKMEAIFQDQSASRQDRRAKMQSIRQDTKSKIEAVLNDQQRQKFEAMQERMRNHRHGGQGGIENSAPAQQN